MIRSVVSLDECGYGDAVVMAWIAEGWKRSGVGSMAFKRGDTSIMGFAPRDSMVELLGQELTDEPATVHVASRDDSLFHAELRIRGEVRPPRTTLWQRWLPAQATPIRPPMVIAEKDQATADASFADDDRPMVVLFPYAVHGQRGWPVHKWLRVAYSLQNRGYLVVAVDGQKKNVDMFPFYAYGMSWGSLAALCRRSVVVAGNDSAGAHLAGTAGVPTVAVMGPTVPTTVFGHCPDVRCIRVERSACRCVGCHFEPERGFGFECNTECEALFMLGWEDVERFVVDTAISAARGGYRPRERATCPS